MADYLLPDVGEGLTEAEIVSWRVTEGDVIEINDIVVEIETAKSLVELPSPYAGTVTALLVPEGETVEVGTAIISIGDPAAAPAEPSATPSPADLSAMDLSNPAASGGGEGESLVGRNKADRGPVRRARKGAASPSTEAGAATQLQLQGAFTPGGAQSTDVVEADEPAVPATPAPEPVEEPVAGGARALAKPPVRKLAKDLGVDLTALTGSGPQGSITREDVQGAIDETAGTSYDVAPTATSSDDVRERREPIKGVRKMMAQAMVGSAFTAPHVTEWVTVDVTRTMEFVERLKQRRDFRDVKVSPLLVLARAAMLAMRRTPEINSWWDEKAQEIVFKSYVNLGIAAATPRGLVVPNVKDAERLALARPGRRPQPAHGHRARREDTAGRDVRRHVHDHQRRGVRRRRRHPDHQPRRVRDPVLRRGPQAALGGLGERRRRDRRTPGHPARAQLRPPPRRRREGLALPLRRRRDHGGPGHSPGFLRLSPGPNQGPAQWHA